MGKTTIQVFTSYMCIFKVNKCILIGKPTAIQTAISFALLGRLVPLQPMPSSSYFDFPGCKFGNKRTGSRD